MPRAIETHRDDSLACDVYAEHFVRASRTSADRPLRPQQVPDGDPLWGRLGRYFGLRTRVLDDFLLSRVIVGVRQVVLLGAGLDTRADRLDWPSGSTDFELDQENAMFDGDSRPDSAGDLATWGWRTSVHTAFEFTRRHGRDPLPERHDALAANRWVFAWSTGSGRPDASVSKLLSR